MEAFESYFWCKEDYVNIKHIPLPSLQIFLHQGGFQIVAVIRKNILSFQQLSAS